MLALLRRFPVIIFKGIVVPYVVIVTILTLFQGWMVYPGAYQRRAEWKAPTIAGVEDVRLHTADGLTLQAWYAPPPGNRPVIVFFHGNGDLIQDRHNLGTFFREQRFGFLFVEYRGYGGNPGKPSEQGLYRDADAAHAFLKNKGVDNRLVAYGESLGTGVATYFASRYPTRATVLLAPFTSMLETVRYQYPWIAGTRFLLRDHFNSLERIAAINAPLFILHGKQDSVIPVGQARTLYAAAEAPKKIRLYPRADHMDLFQFGALERIAGFINEQTSRQAVRKNGKEG